MESCSGTNCPKCVEHHAAGSKLTSTVGYNHFICVLNSAARGDSGLLKPSSSIVHHGGLSKSANDHFHSFAWASMLHVRPCEELQSWCKLQKRMPTNLHDRMRGRDRNERNKHQLTRECSGPRGRPSKPARLLEIAGGAPRSTPLPNGR